MHIIVLILDVFFDVVRVFFCVVVLCRAVGWPELLVAKAISFPWHPLRRPRGWTALVCPGLVTRTGLPGEVVVGGQLTS